MEATDDLRHEHQAVLRMLAVLETVARRPPKSVDVPALEEALEFVRVFVDRCHHYKEEQLLFPALRTAAVTEADHMIAALLEEHESGRALVRRLDAEVQAARAGQGEILAAAPEILERYCALLRRHIAAENDRLFPLADERLAADAQSVLAQGYDRVEREVIGEGRHERFHLLLDQLEQAYAPVPAT